MWIQLFLKFFPFSVRVATFFMLLNENNFLYEPVQCHCCIIALLHYIFSPSFLHSRFVPGAISARIFILFERNSFNRTMKNYKTHFLLCLHLCHWHKRSIRYSASHACQVVNKRNLIAQLFFFYRNQLYNSFHTHLHVCT